MPLNPPLCLSLSSPLSPPILLSLSAAVVRLFRSISCSLALTFVADLRASSNRMRSRVGGRRESSDRYAWHTGLFQKSSLSLSFSSLFFLLFGGCFSGEGKKSAQKYVRARWKLGYATNAVLFRRDRETRSVIRGVLRASRSSDELWSWLTILSNRAYTVYVWLARVAWRILGWTE